MSFIYLLESQLSFGKYNSSFCNAKTSVVVFSATFGDFLHSLGKFN